MIYYNSKLPQTEAEAFAARVNAEGRVRVVGNLGDDDVPYDPCPWPDDGYCDEDLGFCAPGTDPQDCPFVTQ
jgi:hypothetical protein